MCGASASQNQLADEQAAFYQQSIQMTQQQYAEQQAIYAPMAAQFKSMFAAGPNQEGFDAGEVQNLNATAVEGTAENYQQAAKAVNEQEAALGGGNNPLSTGQQEEMKEQVAESTAQTESQEESQIKQADYSQGYNEWQNASTGLEAIATGENPVAYENAATGAGSAAETTENEINTENNSWINAAIGAAGAIGGGAAGGFASCVPKGALILMADGAEIPVETVQAGDLIQGANGPENVMIVRKSHSAILKVYFKDKTTLKCSPSHEFIIASAKGLESREAVTAEKAAKTIILKGEKKGTVTSVRQVGMGTVYSIITDGTHVYCADGAWCIGEDA